MQEVKEVDPQNALRAFFGYSYAGEPGVILTLPAGSFIEESAGPAPGVVMTAPQAREIGLLLLLFAQQLENGHHGLPQRPETPGRTRKTNG